MDMAWHEVGAYPKMTELLMFEAEWAHDAVERPLVMCVLPLSLTLWLRESPLIFPGCTFLLWGEMVWGRWFWMFSLVAQYTQGDKNIMHSDEEDNDLDHNEVKWKNIRKG